MTETTLVLRGFVLVDSENNVLTYDQIRGANLPFLVATYETEFLSGKHGVNGLLKFEGSHITSEGLLEADIAVANFSTPYVVDGRLAAEPTVTTYVIIRSEMYNGEILLLGSNNGWTTLEWEVPLSGECYVEVLAKLSTSRPNTAVMHLENAPSVEKMLGYTPPPVPSMPPCPKATEVPLPRETPSVTEEVEKHRTLYKSMFPLF